MRIGLLGFGTIGRFLADKIRACSVTELAWVVDPFVKPEAAPCTPFLSSFEEKRLGEVDLVVEASNSDVVKTYAEEILGHCDFLAFSVTSLADEAFYDRVKKTTLCRERRFYIPHGAILGLDGVFDGREMLTEVDITTIKTPKGLGSDMTTRTVLFEGSTRDACKKFPKNVNVHACLAMAGIGFDKTQSTIVADPDIKGNTHLIKLRGDGVDFEIKISSIPQGLVTGVYTPWSAFGSILRIGERAPGFCIV